MKPGNTAIIERALTAVANRDLTAYEACLHDDLVLELPYGAGQGPTTTDRAGLLGLIGLILSTFSSIHFHIDRAYELAAPDGLIIEYSSDMRAGDVSYANRYVGIFEFRDGKIARWVEYADPAPFAKAFAAIKAAASHRAG